MLHIAHLSDLHIDGTPAAAERTRLVTSYLDGLTQDLAAVVVTGDIAEHGDVEEYHEAARLLTDRYPVYCCPGNHDHRSTFEEALLAEPVSGEPVNRAHRVPSATFLLCDSTVPGADHGELTPATLEWLELQLAAVPPNDHLFIAFHHPPMPLGMPALAGMLLHNPADLEDLLARSRPVDAILCGHAHSASAGSLGPTPVLVAPGVASTSRLPFERGAPLDDSLPPGLAFHLVQEGAPVVTHFRMVEWG